MSAACRNFRNILVQETYLDKLNKSLVLSVLCHELFI